MFVLVFHVMILFPYYMFLHNSNTEVQKLNIVHWSVVNVTPHIISIEYLENIKERKKKLYPRPR